MLLQPPAQIKAEPSTCTLRKCGLWDAFCKHARYDGEELIFADKNATELVHLRGGERGRPEIAGGVCELGTAFEGGDRGWHVEVRWKGGGRGAV